jgi:hypothetical protein
VSEPVSEQDPIGSMQGEESKPKPVHVLLVCLAVVAVIFFGSIILSVFYVEQNKLCQSDRC